MSNRFWGVGAAIALILSLLLTLPAAAESKTDSAFMATWAYADLPVATNTVHRTWMWGAQPDTGPLLEPYAEAPDGRRLVQYFDKSRMEITHPEADPASPWYVTNGLITREMVTGQLQLGDNSFQQHSPAPINVAGDPDDPNGPTYATFSKLLSYGAIPAGWTINQTVNRAGQVGSDPSLAGQGVVALDVGGPTGHTVASVFWDFMTGSGVVYQQGYRDGVLFPSPFYATGYPLTEAYWTTVLLNGAPKLVLVQIFERRVLTYTPSNAPGWQVESGNVGQHYYRWRYEFLHQAPVAAPEPEATTLGVAPAVPAAISILGATMSFYEIGGSTVSDLVNGLNQHQLSSPDGEHLADTAWNISWQFQQSGGSTCQPINVVVSTRITVTFPHWTPPAGASPELIADWNRFTQALATHEQGHVQLVLDGATRIKTAISGASCDSANAAAQAVVRQIQQDNQAYDARTNHGVTQGATFPS